MTNRPPAPLVLLIFLIFSLVILPVSATTISFIEDSVYSQNYTRTPDTGVSNTRPGYEGMVINKIQDYPYIKQLVFETAAPYTLTDPKKLYASTPFSATMDGNVIGSGFIQYNVNLANNKIIIRYDFNSFDVSGKTGKKWVSFNFNRDALNGLKFVDNKPFVKYIGFDNAPLVFVQFIDGGNAVGTSGDYYIHQKPDFRNDVIFTDINDKVNVEFIRNTNRNHPSTVDIFDTKFLYYSGYGADDFQIASEYPPVTVNVTTVYGKRFSYVYGTSGDPDPDPGDPGDPTAPSRVPVNIVAVDSRSGNLLLDAAVEVRDQNDTVVATGSTSPNGWLVFEYDLPATLTDEDFQRYYTVNITLPGWTQKVPALQFFPAFIPRSGDWIRVEMLPDSSGPADPGKTYLMFYVRDTAGNGLPGAYVNIDGEYWGTNNAGHVAVAVAKNATYPYTVSKSGHMTVSGSATVADAPSYQINVVLGAGSVPTYTPTPGETPGGPGATPTPDRRSNEEKGQAVIDMVADNAEGIGALALICLLMGLLKLMVKW